ncbi:putative reverse transcriptase domain-containing protein, partial [Tanacetum coccineum]
GIRDVGYGIRDTWIDPAEAVPAVVPTACEEVNTRVVELDSFDVIIGMDWLRRHHAVIVYDEKLVRVPFGNETLVFRGAESYIGRESRLTFISCSKVQEYMAKGCHVFLAHIFALK